MDLFYFTAGVRAGPQLVVSMPSSLVLVGDGLIFGIIHVLTGPDHLTAMAAMTSGEHWVKAFWMGIRWGLGHSTGLLLVAVLFLALDGHLDLAMLSWWCNWFIGVAMVILGAYMIYRAVKVEREEELDEAVKKLVQLASAMVAAEEGRKRASGREGGDTDDDDDDEVKEFEDKQGAGARGGRDRRVVTHLTFPKRDNSISSKGAVASSSSEQEEEHSPAWYEGLRQRSISFGIGVIHGAGAPGAVLGVLPAVEAKSWPKAMLYLAAFSLTSVLIMGVFSAIYGDLTSQVGRGSGRRKVDLGIRIFSACLSIMVGVLWLVLSGLGILDDVLP